MQLASCEKGECRCQKILRSVGKRNTWRPKSPPKRLTDEAKTYLLSCLCIDLALFPVKNLLDGILQHGLVANIHDHLCALQATQMAWRCQRETANHCDHRKEERCPH